MANSTQTATSDGTLELLALSFNYLDRSEIAVYFNSVLTTAWEWVGDTDKIIKFVPVVPNGVNVLVRRTTASTTLRHQYSSGAKFDAATLDESLSQVLHIVQEAQESNLSADFFGPLNMHSNKITGVSNGTDPLDAANVQQVVALSAPSVASAAASASAAAASAASAAASAASAAAAEASAEDTAGDLLALLGDVLLRDGSRSMLAELLLQGNASSALAAVPKQQAESIASTAASSAVADRKRVQRTVRVYMPSLAAASYTWAIPSWVDDITVHMDRVSKNSDSGSISVRLGTSSGIEATGYYGSAAYVTAFGTGAVGLSSGIDTVFSGNVDHITGDIRLYHLGDNSWQFSGNLSVDHAASSLFLSGGKTLAGLCTQLRMLTTGAVFDSGYVSITLGGWE